MISKIAIFAAAAVMAVGLSAGSAMAGGYPTNITGTWNAQDDRSLLTIDIHQTPASSSCNEISGTIGSDDLVGFYCPATGRFDFVRNNSTSGVTIQEYSDNVSSIGTPEWFMSGIFGSVVQPTGGNLGEYSFYATFIPPPQ
jgi:hypothetical protein